MSDICQQAGRAIEAPFDRMSYDEAIARYGTDKPDLRCALEIQDVSKVFVATSFNVFRKVVAGGGVVRALVVPGGGRYARHKIDKLVDEAIERGRQGGSSGFGDRRTVCRRALCPRRQERTIPGEILDAVGAGAG